MPVLDILSRLIVVRSLFFTILVPGTVAVLIPYWIITRNGFTSPAASPALSAVGLLLMVCGAGILGRCIWEFAAWGKGTLAPIDPPRELVVRGLYRYVRNPMYLGVLILLLGEALFFRSVPLLRYAAGWFVVVHLFVVLYEEPTLRLRFGQSYERYVQSVHRWIPVRPPA